MHKSIEFFNIFNLNLNAYTVIINQYVAGTLSKVEYGNKYNIFYYDVFMLLVQINAYTYTNNYY